MHLGRHSMGRLWTAQYNSTTLTYVYDTPFTS